MNYEAISMEAAIAITNRSRSTWWRYIADGKITRRQDDARGRAMLSWHEVVPDIIVSMDCEELSMLLVADAGDAVAQNEIGQIFLRREEYRAAIYWFKQAASKNSADAMHWLAHCYINGKGVEKDTNKGIMWLANSASSGHLISQAVMNKILSSEVAALV